MPRVNKKDWSRKQTSKRESFLIVFSLQMKITVVVIDKNKISDSVNASGKNELDAFYNAIEKIYQKRKNIPKNVVLVSYNCRVSLLDGQSEIDQNNEQLRRSFQFSVNDTIDEIFRHPNDLQVNWSNDVFKIQEVDQIIDFVDGFPEDDDLESVINSLNLNEKIIQQVGNYGLGNMNSSDLNISWVPFDQERSLVSLLPKATVQLWQEKLIKRKFNLCTCISFPLLTLLSFPESEIVVFLDSQNALILNSEGSENQNLIDYKRENIMPPQIIEETIIEAGKSEKVVIVAGNSDAKLLSDSARKFVVDPFSTKQLKKISQTLIDQLALETNVREISFHSIHDIPPIFFKTKGFWQYLGFLVSIGGISSQILPSYLEEKKLISEYSQLEQSMETLQLDLSELRNNKTQLKEIENRISILSQSLSGSNSANSITMWKPQDYKSLISLLSECMKNTPNLQIESVDLRDSGRLSLTGASLTIAEARYFTDKFLESLDDKKHPSHVVKIERDSNTEVYKFTITHK